MFVSAFVFLLCVCVLLSYLFQEQRASFLVPVNGSAKSSNQYAAFRNNYLAVHLLMMMGDWLQGPYVYVLYKSYGYSLDDIGLLFVIGFLSSAFFGTIISSLADVYGRKKLCLAFVVIYVASCLTKLSSHFQVLLLGRVFGGIATSLLFSVFEAWMVTVLQGFDAELLSDTFSWATYGNGVVAILSGILANAVADWSGSYAAPFMLAIIFLTSGGIVILLTWSDNYGQSGRESGSPMLLNGSSVTSLTLFQRIKFAFADTRIVAVGVIVSLFEGSMYTFVFLWGPVLEKNDVQDIPYGLIFASFMVCLMIGSILFRIVVKERWSIERAMHPLLLVAAFAMCLPALTASSSVAFWAFNLFEVCCGFYFPAIGMLRSRYVPEEIRATMMNIFRIPLNVIVVVVLTKVTEWSHTFIFSIVTALILIGFAASVLLAMRIASLPSSISRPS